MSLVEQTKTALDESRMLMLGAQILLGFQFQAPFQDAFSQLLPTERAIELFVLCLMILVVGFVIAPSARHRLLKTGLQYTRAGPTAHCVLPTIAR